MKKIDDRFYETDNGILFDTDTNFVIKPISVEGKEISRMILQYGQNLNQTILSHASYADGSNFAINLNLTSACNLNCTYCFARGGDYVNRRTICRMIYCQRSKI